MTSLRWRLAASIAAILIASLTITFAAVYHGTADDMRDRIDDDLAIEINALAERVASGDSAPFEEASLATASQLLIVQAPGRRPLINRPELLGLEENGNAPEGLADARRLLTAPQGYVTIEVEDDVGAMRVLSTVVDGTTVRAGEPLDSVARALTGIVRTFVVAGSITLVVAIVAGSVVAVATAAPLRRIAGIAARVRDGQLSERIGAQGPPDEVRELAAAFDTMLDRLKDAFVRQRSFTADASHELRTPLTIVRGQLEVLARQPEVSRADVLRVEQVVNHEVQRMERLVDDLLLLAHSEQDVGWKLEEIDVPEFLSELFDGLTLTAERRFELGDLPAGHLTGDPDRLAQAVRNLTRNAVEHTEVDGLVRLEAFARSSALEIAVVDDGPGIPPDERTRVFDRLHRLDRARSRRAGGGLGLAITQAVVQAHGGRVWAEAAPTGGARVGLLLRGFRLAAEPQRTVGDGVDTERARAGGLLGAHGSESSAGAPSRDAAAADGAAEPWDPNRRRPG